MSSIQLKRAEDDIKRAEDYYEKTRIELVKIKQKIKRGSIVEKDVLNNIEKRYKISKKYLLNAKKNLQQLKRGIKIAQDKAKRKQKEIEEAAENAILIALQAAKQKLLTTLKKEQAAQIKNNEENEENELPDAHVEPIPKVEDTSGLYLLATLAEIILSDKDEIIKQTAQNEIKKIAGVLSRNNSILLNDIDIKNAIYSTVVEPIAEADEDSNAAMAPVAADAAIVNAKLQELKESVPEAKIGTDYLDKHIPDDSRDSLIKLIMMADSIHDFIDTGGRGKITNCCSDKLNEILAEAQYLSVAAGAISTEKIEKKLAEIYPISTKRTVRYKGIEESTVDYFEEQFPKLCNFQAETKVSSIFNTEQLIIGNNSKYLSECKDDCVILRFGNDYKHGTDKSLTLKDKDAAGDRKITTIIKYYTDYSNVGNALLEYLFGKNNGYEVVYFTFDAVKRLVSDIIMGLNKIGTDKYAAGEIITPQNIVDSAGTSYDLFKLDSTLQDRLSEYTKFNIESLGYIERTRFYYGLDTMYSNYFTKEAPYNMEFNFSKVGDANKQDKPSSNFTYDISYNAYITKLLQNKSNGPTVGYLKKYMLNPLKGQHGGLQGETSEENDNCMSIYPIATRILQPPAAPSDESKKLFNKMCFDIKRMGDHEQANALQYFIRNNLGYKGVFVTGDKLAALYSRLIGNPTIYITQHTLTCYKGIPIIENLEKQKQIELENIISEINNIHTKCNLILQLSTSSGTLYNLINNIHTYYLPYKYALSLAADASYEVIYIYISSLLSLIQLASSYYYLLHIKTIFKSLKDKGIEDLFKENIYLDVSAMSFKEINTAIDTYSPILTAIIEKYNTLKDDIGFIQSVKQFNIANIPVAAAGGAGAAAAPVLPAIPSYNTFNPNVFSTDGKQILNNDTININADNVSSIISSLKEYINSIINPGRPRRGTASYIVPDYRSNIIDKFKTFNSELLITKIFSDFFINIEMILLKRDQVPAGGAGGVIPSPENIASEIIKNFISGLGIILTKLETKIQSLYHVAQVAVPAAVPPIPGELKGGNPFSKILPLFRRNPQPLQELLKTPLPSSYIKTRPQSSPQLFSVDSIESVLPSHKISEISETSEISKISYDHKIETFTSVLTQINSLFNELKEYQPLKPYLYIIKDSNIISDITVDVYLQQDRDDEYKDKDEDEDEIEDEDNIIKPLSQIKYKTHRNKINRKYRKTYRNLLKKLGTLKINKKANTRKNK